MLHSFLHHRIIFLVISVVFFLFTAWIAPERLIPLGIMDFSLTSDNELTRRTALLEISLAKYACLALGVLFLLFFFLMPSFKKTAFYHNFMARDLYYPQPYEDNLKAVIDRAFIWVFALTALTIVYLLTAEALLPGSARSLMHREDGIIEYTSAFLLIIAAGYAGYTGIFAKNIRLAPRMFHLFLAFLFFAMCGEEISWGQRILGYGTPETLSNLNVQNEVNLHNMFGYLFDHLFILSFFLWGCVVPFMFHFSTLNAQIIRWIGLPVPSIGLAIGMLLITFYQDKVLFLFIDGLRGLRIPEVRELLSATAFLLMMQQSRKGLVPR